MAKVISKKNNFYTRIGAINYLVKNSVYTNEWTGAGMYEAIEKIVNLPTRKKPCFSKSWLDEELAKAAKR